MKFLRAIAWIVFFWPTLTMATSPVSKTIDKFSATGGTAFTVPASGIWTIAQTTPPPTTLTESSNAVTIDWSTGNAFTLTLNANLSTVTFSNATSGQTIVVAITNTASNFTVTLGNSIKWVGGSQPVQTVGAHTDVWTIIDLGGTFYGNVVQNF